MAVASVRSQSAQAAAVRVAASNELLADIVRVVGGSKVKVTPILHGPGCLHSYVPTSADAKLVDGCSMFIAGGLGGDRWADKLIASTAGTSLVVIRAGGDPPLRDDLGQHAYFDPDVVSEMALRVARGLASVDPANAGYYGDSARQYARDLRDLKAWAMNSIAPYQSAHVVSYSAALGALLLALSLEPTCIVEEGHEQAVTPRHIADAGRAARESRATLVLADRERADLARSMAKGCGAQLLLLDPTVVSGDSYVGMYQADVGALVKALAKAAKP